MFTEIYNTAKNLYTAREVREGFSGLENLIKQVGNDVSKHSKSIIKGSLKTGVAYTVPLVATVMYTRRNKKNNSIPEQRSYDYVPRVI